MYTVNRSVPSVRPLPLPSNDKYVKIALDKNPVWGASSKKRKIFNSRLRLHRPIWKSEIPIRREKNFARD